MILHQKIKKKSRNEGDGQGIIYRGKQFDKDCYSCTKNGDEPMIKKECKQKTYKKIAQGASQCFVLPNPFDRDIVASDGSGGVSNG